MEMWWPPSHHIGAQPFQTIIVEPRAGCRWVERDTQGTECNWGHVLAWDPPGMWRSPGICSPWKFDPDPARASEIEIRFTAEGPARTFVELTHSGIERHGEGWEKLLVAVDGPGAWESILAAFARKSGLQPAHSHGNLMKPVLLIRIASLLTFLHAVLHTIGGVFGRPAPGPAQAAVAAMKANQFAVMGLPRTYWDFYHGSGLAIGIMLLVEAAVFWQLATIAKTLALSLRPILATFLCGYLALAVNSYQYFFAPPVIVEVLIAACLGLAILTARPVPA